MNGAARATAARQLASGAVQAYPRARPLVPVAATTSCRLENGGSPFLSTAAVGTDSGRLYKEPPSPSSPSGDLKPPHLAPP